MKKYSLDVFFSFCAVMLCVVFLRLIPHVPNVSPIAALALFSGALIPSWRGFVLPILSMVFSDIFLGFHPTIPFVYGSFILIFCIGYFLRKKISILNVGFGSLVGSIIFYIITNFGVWATSSMYEKNVNGLVHSYVMGLPFFRNTIVGDIFFTYIFFLGYQTIKLFFILILPSRQKTERHIGNTV